MNWLIILLVFISIIFATLGAIFLKKGSKSFNINISIKGIVAILKNYVLIAGIILYGFSAIFFISALRLGELSMIYPLSSLTYIFISLFSVHFLKEKMNLYKWIGISFIILGVILVTI